ncbi:hypothetical protein Tco_0835815 [Tanacetum coccineum]
MSSATSDVTYIFQGIRLQPDCRARSSFLGSRLLGDIGGRIPRGHRTRKPRTAATSQARPPLRHLGFYTRFRMKSTIQPIPQKDDYEGDHLGMTPCEGDDDEEDEDDEEE